MGLTLQPAITALQRVSELFELTGEKDGGIKISKLRGEIEFKDVYFSYNCGLKGRKDVLKGISFKINPCEKVLLQGPNGSGKSTIVKLILGLYRTDSGEIFIDGNEISQLSLSSLRERISFVSQNVFLFNDTIKNNILYSRPSAKDEEVIESARLSGAYDFIMNFEDGFDTLIGEGGKALSGGERKKLSVARAILKDSDIIIFDEATSEMDSESEERVEKLIKERFKDKTCIIISHKPSGSNFFDRVFLLEDGKMKESRSPLNFSE